VYRGIDVGYIVKYAQVQRFVAGFTSFAAAKAREVGAMPYCSEGKMGRLDRALTAYLVTQLGVDIGARLTLQVLRGFGVPLLRR
jgi:hypothetical protein